MGVVREVGLPAGVVTMLFTDIEGSTRLLTELGDAYGGVLAEHHRLLRRVWSRKGGVEVSTEGDSFFVAFPDPVAAVEAATEAQRVLAGHDWGQGVTLKVRMGLHTGRPRVRDGEYWGLDVHYAARLAAAANGGQVLVSESTAGLVEAELEYLGEHRLKDFAVPRGLFHLVVDGRSSDEFPAPRTLRSGRTNLPAQLSSFVGREQELKQISVLLQQGQLVSLVGPGGVGKSRLSLAAGSLMLDGSGHGVWLVELAALSEGGLVAGETARVLGVSEQAGKPVLDTLVDSVRDRKLLLILDNCEHLIDAAAELGAALCAGCPGVFVLATSREPLGVPGERVFRVPSLSLPDGNDPGKSEAVELFVERAQERRPEFALDRTNTDLVVSVVRRLDGIPLALELAAARLKSLALTDLQARLDHSLRLLTGGARTAAGRQRTLKALIDWSYDLLDRREQALLDRLSVFAGGFDLEAVEALCTGEQIDELDVVDLLGSLVDKSLVQVDDAGEHLRYRLLELVRQYAAEKLSARGEQVSSAIHDAHRRHYLAMAEEAEQKRFGPDAENWIDRVELEHDNVRAALARCAEDPDPELGLRLATAVAFSRYYRGRGPEAATGLLEQLNRPEAAKPTLVRGRALVAAVRPVNAALDDRRLASDLAQEAISIARDAEDLRLEARALGELSWVQLRLSLFDEGLASADRAVELSRRAGDSQLLGFALTRLSWAQQRTGEPFRETLAEAAQVARENGNRRTLATVLQDLGITAIDDGDPATARRYFAEMGDMAREVNDFALVLGSQGNGAMAAFLDGDIESANAAFHEVLRKAKDSYPIVRPYMLNGLALTAETRQPERSAWLHGAVDRLLADTGSDLENPDGRLRQESRDRLRARLGDAPFEAQVEAGRAMPTEAAISAALQD